MSSKVRASRISVKKVLVVTEIDIKLPCASLVYRERELGSLFLTPALWSIENLNPNSFVNQVCYSGICIICVRSCLRLL